MPVPASSPSAAQQRVADRLADATLVTEEQVTACKHEGGAFIAACPGSGKTRTVGMRLAYRAAFAPDESVAAMSHTNTAVEEIRRAAAQLLFVPDHYFVGTLHAFLLRYIVYPFGHLYMKCSATPRVVGGQADWERISLPTIGAPDHKNLRVQAWLFDIRLRSDGEGELVYRRPGRWPPSLTSEVIVQACGGWGGDEKEAYWKRGLLSYSDVPWVAYAVLTDHESIAPALAARFDELIVDEVQDTPPLQLACLRKLRVQPSQPNLAIVGDLCQSIYEWSDATPEGVRTFSEEQELLEIPFTANFRSSQLICDVTHRFSTRAKPDRAAGPTAGITAPPELWTYKRNQETQLANRFRDRLAAEGIAEQDSSILARVHALVAKLNGAPAAPSPPHWLLRELGRAATERDTGAGPTRDTFRQLDRAVNFIAFGDTQPANPSQRQREDVRLASGELLERLPPVDGDLKAWNLQSRGILASVAADVPGASPQNVNKFMTDASTLAGVDAVTALAPPPVGLARTIHDAKGETISAVMVVARKEDAEQWVAGAWLDDPPEHVSEEVRVAYVAFTRCARLLVLAVPEATPTDARQKLVDVGFIEA